jgi:hypothetical protein
MRWKWLHHEYESGGVAYISAVDAYSRMDLCTPIFLGEASNKISPKEVSHLILRSKPDAHRMYVQHQVVIHTGRM